LAISTMISDKSSYKRVIVNELVLDKEGQKMSKSRGNSVVPAKAIDKYGVDAIRWYFASVSFPWAPKRYDNAGVEETFRKFFNTLLNTYSFFAMYANIDKFDRNSQPIEFAKRPEMDRWILSALYKLVEETESNLKNYDITRSSRAISAFVLDELSNWYVRRNRRRFWKSGDSNDKLAAYQTLHEVLLTLTKLSAPFIPFLSEWLYKNLRKTNTPESVHLCDYPSITEEMKACRNIELETKMTVTENVVSLIRALRNKTQIKVRQPLLKSIVATADANAIKSIQEMEEIIKEEVNIKEVEIVEDSASFVIKSIKPNFKTLGPRYGKQMGKIAGIIKGYSPEEIKHIEENKEAWLSIEGNDVHIKIEDVEISIEPADHYEVVHENNLIIGLDTEITAELKEEGLAREFVNRVQNLRKDAGFEITDKIKIGFTASEELQNAVKKQIDYVKNETLSQEVLFTKLKISNIMKEIEIENETTSISLQKIS
ncbi:MAG: class I tRNA ligase family protein, partial [Calditrichia bacterium]|nr:class I tRNA ligase family protein [Calditrichia bacterium]